MGIKSNMAKRYTAEFKRDAAALIRSSPHRNVTEIARELGVSPEGLRGWVKQHKTDRGESRPGELTTAEREELTRLRRQTSSSRRRSKTCARRPPISRPRRHGDPLPFRR
ncbi:transposase [Streptomyces sp. SP17BM10]|uniref:transposase n=1 Tax=Streptomyces sp. SP17BM10 TaxID=3002530 RepID=UPI002E79DCC6|nr:transposase [Streptomyces sp. SP17BM10]MEE1783381.1 transposase [Streptomyces sp. SP17BM10]